MSLDLKRESNSRLYKDNVDSSKLLSTTTPWFLVMGAAIQLLWCTLQASVILAQASTTSTAASGGLHYQRGEPYPNSLVTSERPSTSGPPASARNFQPSFGLPTVVTTPTSTLSTSTAGNLLLATSTGASRLSNQLAQQTSFAPTAQLYQQPQRKQQQQQPPQPKSLKFTLIAGKYWKFNIKTNSLQTSHRERELRLHGNDSAKNFIIDDDGWFQYNHQQQQLFAWPSLSVKPSTYYFVLLPSGLDYEADGENVIDPNDIVANIVVELIRPYVGSTSKFDIDQLIDHKFSLDYLHRHSTYPLLLSQIVSIFDILSPRTNSTSVASLNGVSHNTNQATSTTTTATTTTTTTTTTLSQASTTTTNSIVAALQQSKQTRLLSNKLVEFLLIDSSASADGEYFSITWTTHPSLVNNTVHPIQECRIAAINETISRLSSSRSVLYPSVDDKFVISYSLEGPLVSTHSIIPTERGNFALKLSLLNLCRHKRIIDELGVTSESGFPTDIDDRDNSIPDQPLGSTSSHPVEPQTSGSPTSVSVVKESSSQGSHAEPTDGPDTKITKAEKKSNSTPTLEFQHSGLSGQPNVTSELARDSTSSQSSNDAQLSTRASDHSSTLRPLDVYTPTTTELSPASTDSTKPQVSEIETTTPTQSSSIRPAIGVLGAGGTSAKEEAASAAGRLPSPPAHEPSRELLASTQTNTRRALETTTVQPSQPTPFTHLQHQHPQQQTNSQPQAKSFANFLDPKTDFKPRGSTMSLNNSSKIGEASTSGPDIVQPLTSGPNVTFSTNTTGNLPLATKNGQETSLNDDLIGILNEVMEFLISVAVPLSIILGLILIASILIAICNLCAKRRKSKQFEVSDRFKFRYGSERKMFLKNSSKPVILEADQKSLSMGGTPQHKPLMTPNDNKTREQPSKKQKQKSKRGAPGPSDGGADFFAMSSFSGGGSGAN